MMHRKNASVTVNRGAPCLSRWRILAGVVFATLAASVSPAPAADSTVSPDASLDTLLRARTWLNGTPTRETLRGKVVLVDVFTFACFNCQNITPNLRTLSRTKRDGLAILGIHSPETAYEHDRGEVISHFASLGVTWPVAIDNDFALWRAYNIEFWPTQMIFDRRGRLRKVVIGDSQDATVDATVGALLREPSSVAVQRLTGVAVQRLTGVAVQRLTGTFGKSSPRPKVTSHSR